LVTFLELKANRDAFEIAPAEMRRRRQSELAAGALPTQAY
jgi:hypothetical protein